MRSWVVTCEHGGNFLPEVYKHLFTGREEVLNTHRGIDIGSKAAYEVLKEKADYARLHEVTRLLIELNRSLHHPGLFSEFSNTLEASEKQKLIDDYYLPYRNSIEEKVKAFISAGREVVHVSVHSFTPVLNGQVRNADVGFLYDPSRLAEKEFCKTWKENFKLEYPGLRVRFNYPYLGKADGFTTALRKMFPENYIGIELEVNQKHQKRMAGIASALLKSLP